MYTLGHGSLHSAHLSIYGLSMIMISKPLLWGKPQLNKLKDVIRFRNWWITKVALVRSISKSPNTVIILCLVAIFLNIERNYRSCFWGTNLQAPNRHFPIASPVRKMSVSIFLLKRPLIFWWITLIELHWHLTSFWRSVTRGFRVASNLCQQN